MRTKIQKKAPYMINYQTDMYSNFYAYDLDRIFGSYRLFNKSIPLSYIDQIRPNKLIRYWEVKGVK